MPDDFTPPGIVDATGEPHQHTRLTGTVGIRFVTRGTLSRDHAGPFPPDPPQWFADLWNDETRGPLDQETVNRGVREWLSGKPEPT